MILVMPLLEVYAAFALFFSLFSLNGRFWLAHTPVHLVKYQHDVPVCVSMKSLVLPASFSQIFHIKKTAVCLCLYVVLFSSMSI